VLHAFASVPSSSGSGSGNGRRSDHVSTGLGLHGMSQKQFEKIVKTRVTSEVAQVLLKTMRPLRRVLTEQEEKIEDLEAKHGQRQKAEKRCCLCIRIECV
jgi:hypothetical protein